MSFIQNVEIFWIYCIVTWNLVFSLTTITFYIRHSNWCIVCRTLFWWLDYWFRSLTVQSSMNVGRLLIGRRFGGWMKGMTWWSKGGGGYVGYIPMFKITSNILLREIVCLSVSWFFECGFFVDIKTFYIVYVWVFLW
jgi:hypothetical protein